MEAKQLKLTFLLAVLMSMVGAKAFAYDFAVKNADGVTIYYGLINNSTEVEVSYRGSSSSSYSGVVNIPESVTYGGKTYSVTSIGSSAFYGCSGLTSITIPNSVTSIGSSAFYGCSGLTEINVDENNSTYSSIDGVVFNKSQTELVCYPGGKQGAYTIPNSVTSIEGSAFSGCSGLTSVTIPNSVTSIEGSAFWECHGLTSVTIGNSVTSIGSYAFYDCTGLTSIDIPNSVKSIGNGAFSGCTGLTSVTIPNSVTSIGSSAFSHCSGLTEINVDENNSTYSSIDGVLFNKSQTELVCYPYGKQGAYTIPNSVKSIGNGAFDGCTGLTSVTIPNSVTSIGSSAFYGCSGLTEINVDENNSTYSSIDGVLFNKSQTELIQYPGGKQGAYTIPNSVTSIGPYAFSFCTGLTSVTIPNSVTSIGFHAFHYCSGLTSVTIPNSVTSIETRVFLGCTGLTSVTIPNSVTSIGIQAFTGCTGLTSITIPNSVTSIGVAAFENCSGLTSITIPNSVTSIGSSAFYNCSGLTDIYCHIEEPLTIASRIFMYVPTNTCTLHVPIGSKVKYQAADVWKKFLNIVEDLPTGIVSIDNSQLTIDNDVWFTLNGVRLNGKPTRNGVYLVKYNNGNIRKVMIK